MTLCNYLSYHSGKHAQGLKILAAQLSAPQKIDALMVKSVITQKSQLLLGELFTVIASLLIEPNSTHKCIFILVMGTINHSTLLNKIHIT